MMTRDNTKREHTMGTSYQVPKALQARFDVITAETQRICAELQLDEYADLACKMAAALARKRPSPLTTGTVTVWACGILYALGRVNFLFDKSESPYVTPEVLCAPADVKARTAAAKAKLILDLLKVTTFDPEWTLLSRLGDNPMAWMVQLSNGLMIDVRHAPRALQEEAYRLGLIPYIPDDQMS
jgi:hypothetical protein